MNYLWVFNRIEYLLRRIDRRVVVSKKIPFRHVGRHIVHIVLERKLDILVLELDVKNALVLAAVDIAYLLDVADDALFAFVRAPLRQVEIDHLRNAGAVTPGMIALVLLLRPVHRKRGALEIEVCKAFKRTCYERVGANMDYMVDVGVPEIPV